MASHNLIPEKTPTFECEEGIYFDKFLGLFTDVLDASVAEMKSWEDETVLLTLERSQTELSVLTQHKLLAFKNINSDDINISTPLEFRNLATLLNEDTPITDSLEPIDPAYVAWAIEALEENDKDNSISVTDEVATYIALCFHEDGFTFMPEDLSIFNEYLAPMTVSEPLDEEQPERYKRIEEYLRLKRLAKTSY